jgi:hypothetical protein
MGKRSQFEWLEKSTVCQRWFFKNSWERPYSWFLAEKGIRKIQKQQEKEGPHWQWLWLKMYDARFLAGLRQQHCKI